MAQKEFIECPVPEGYAAMSRPVEPGTRIEDSDIELKHIDEDDMLTLAWMFYESFPDVWFDKHEDPKTRPPLDVRIRRFAEHTRPHVHEPGFHGIKAVDKHTGAIMGYAGWHEPGKPGQYPTTYPGTPGEWPSSFMPCVYRRELFYTPGFEWTAKLGVTNEQVEEWYSHVGQTFQENCVRNDTARHNEMGDTPHWYLAPLFVDAKYRGRGVGKLLLDWAIERADKTSPPTPLVLEAMPNAKPVYLHMGFEPTDGLGEGKGSPMVRRGPRKN